MKCVAGRDYEVVRFTHPYSPQRGEVRSLDCCYCLFRVIKNTMGQPRTSTSGLGRYNRMRGRMVKHLHEHHRDELTTPPAGDARDERRRP